MSSYVNDIHYMREQLPMTFELLTLLANGFTHEEARKSLGLTEKQAHNRLEYARKKYDATTTLHLIAKVVSSGMVDYVETSY
jgi:hypothetical protein